MNLVVDANVVVKLFVQEPLSDLARDVFASGDTLLAPAHLLGEVGEVLLRRRRLGEISVGQLDVAFVGLPRSVIAISLADLFEPAFVIAATLSISFCDALYVAAAEIWDAILITADMRMIAAIRASAWQRRAIPLTDWPLPERSA